ncbi:MAG TPA: APC family permease [Candidatus Dormibacteraeota bacterium]|nr:APC family permease [Candidatus Dormibacteraeota bacterium]
MVSGEQGQQAAADSDASQALRRELKLPDAAAFSVGLIGPVGAMALLGVGAAGILGRNAIWAFIFALVGVSFVAYAFVQLSRYIAHTGSVYALVGITLGPRAGFFAGWALLGAYLAIGAGSAIEIGLFAGDFLRTVGLVDSKEWIFTVLIAFALVAVVVFRQIHVITRTLLISELIGVVLVTVLTVVIIVRLATGHAPHGQTLNADLFLLPTSTNIGTIASAAVFGFLAFTGFEGAAALGEETQNPRTQIPRAIIIAIAIVGGFFLLTIAGQTLGYGTDTGGVSAFQAANSPYGDLARAYVNSAMAAALDLVACISLFAIVLGDVAAGGRILFALARDAGGSRGIARLSRTGEPVVALGIVLLVVLADIVAQRISGEAELDATFYALTIGTLAVLIAYLMATVGAVKFLFLERQKRAQAWQVIMPLAGIALVCYTIYKNVVGVNSPYDRFPYIVGVWLIVGLGIVLFIPGVRSRIGNALAQAAKETSVRP